MTEFEDKALRLLGGYKFHALRGGLYDALPESDCYALAEALTKLHEECE